ncbi:MAG: hypothetical protein PVSMB9_09670 [Candidatus Dormibacteria bacterium]
MPGVLDWLAVGDVGIEYSRSSPDGILGGGAARLAVHAAALGAGVALVAKLGDDDAGRRATESLRRSKIDLRWLQRAAELGTTAYHLEEGEATGWRVERGADAALRLDELPSAAAAPAKLVVVSGYSLRGEPARSAALGALATARSRQGRAALFMDGELLWQTSSRMTLRLLEPAIGRAQLLALSSEDLSLLFGAMREPREALRSLSDMGPKVIYLYDSHGMVWLREGGRTHACTAAGVHEPRDRYAGAASFWVEVGRGKPARLAAQTSVRYAQAVRRAGQPPTVKP